MRGLEGVISRLEDGGIAGELWINGSFLTEKIDPNDVDVVLRMEATFYDNATISQKRIIDWLNTDLKPDYHCDSYYFMEYPVGHANYLIGQDMRKYWSGLWGSDRSGNPKGYAVIEVGVKSHE